MNTLPEYPNGFLFRTEIDRATAEYLALFDKALKFQEADALQRNRCNAASAAASIKRNEDNMRERQQQELEEQRLSFELSLVQRMRDKGLLSDADYVAHSFGLKTEEDKKWEK